MTKLSQGPGGGGAGGGVSPAELQAALDAKTAIDNANYGRVEMTRARQGAVAVALGDSMTAYEGNDGYGRSVSCRNWFNQMCIASGGRIISGGTYAAGGYTTQQIHDLLLPMVLAIPAPRKPAACFILSMRLGNDVATAGTIASRLALVDDICTQLIAAGIAPIWLTVPARSDGYQRSSEAWNATFTRYVAQKGYIVLDAYPAWANVDGTCKNPYASGAHGEYYGLPLALPIAGPDGGDGSIHPSPAGAAVLGRVLAADPRLVALFPPVAQPLLTSSADTSDLLGGIGLFATDGGGGVGAGWTIIGGGTATRTLVADSNIRGQWQRAVIASTSAGVTVQYKPCVAPIVGHRYALIARIRTEGLDAATAPAVDTGLVSLQLGTDIGTSYPMSAWTTDVGDLTGIGGIAYAELTAPAGAATLNMMLVLNPPTAGSYTVDIAQVALRDLTALGAPFLPQPN